MKATYKASLPYSLFCVRCLIYQLSKLFNRCSTSRNGIYIYIHVISYYYILRPEMSSRTSTHLLHTVLDILFFQKFIPIISMDYTLNFQFHLHSWVFYILSKLLVLDKFTLLNLIAYHYSKNIYRDTYTEIHIRYYNRQSYHSQQSLPDNLLN